MAGFNPRNIFACVVPTVIILFSVYWFRKRRKIKQILLSKPESLHISESKDPVSPSDECLVLQQNNIFDRSKDSSDFEVPEKELHLENIEVDIHACNSSDVVTGEAVDFDSQTETTVNDIDTSNTLFQNISTSVELPKLQEHLCNTSNIVICDTKKLESDAKPSKAHRDTVVSDYYFQNFSDLKLPESQNDKNNGSELQTKNIEEASKSACHTEDIIVEAKHSIYLCNTSNVEHKNFQEYVTSYSDLSGDNKLTDNDALKEIHHKKENAICDIDTNEENVASYIRNAEINSDISVTEQIAASNNSIAKEGISSSIFTEKKASCTMIIEEEIASDTVAEKEATSSSIEVEEKLASDIIFEKKTYDNNVRQKVPDTSIAEEKESFDSGVAEEKTSSDISVTEEKTSFDISVAEEMTSFDMSVGEEKITADANDSKSTFETELERKAVCLTDLKKFVASEIHEEKENEEQLFTSCEFNESGQVEDICGKEHTTIPENSKMSENATGSLEVYAEELDMKWTSCIQNYEFKEKCDDSCAISALHLNDFHPHHITDVDGDQISFKEADIFDAQRQNQMCQSINEDGSLPEDFRYFSEPSPDDGFVQSQEECVETPVVEGEMDMQRQQDSHVIQELTAVKNQSTPQDRLDNSCSNLNLENNNLEREPSISPPHSINLSDIQSEGSSDSGKGSDVNTGAEAAIIHTGDTTDNYIYQFELPQELCGRLIGKHGKHVKYIKERSNATVYIKRHHYNPQLKLAVIEGCKSDVHNALELVRKKFPPSQFPTVTLAQISPVTSRGLAVPESLQLHLPEGVSCDVILSSMVNAGHFFLQQPTHPTYPSLSTLDQCMLACYSQLETPHLPQPVEAGVICAATIMRGWYRAQVIYVYESGEECEVKFVDYGGYSQVPVSSLRQIRSDFMSLPFQASECYLANVKPRNEDIGWTLEASATFEELAQGQILQALIVAYAEDGTPYVHLYRVQGITSTFINQELVDRGVAKWVEHH